MRWNCAKQDYLTLWELRGCSAWEVFLSYRTSVCTACQYHQTAAGRPCTAIPRDANTNKKIWGWDDKRKLYTGRALTGGRPYFVVLLRCCTPSLLTHLQQRPGLFIPLSLSRGHDAEDTRIVVIDKIMGRISGQCQWEEDRDAVILLFLSKLLLASFFSCSETPLSHPKSAITIHIDLGIIRGTCGHERLKLPDEFVAPIFPPVA